VDRIILAGGVLGTGQLVVAQHSMIRRRTDSGGPYQP